MAVTFHELLANFGNIRPGLSFCVQDGQPIICDKRALHGLISKMSRLTISHHHAVQEATAKVFLRFLSRHEAEVNSNDVMPLSKIYTCFYKKKKYTVEREELLQFIAHLVRQNTASLFLHLPKEVLLNIAKVDRSGCFFFLWRTLCRTSRDLLPLEELVHTSTIRAQTIAKFVIRYLRNNDRGAAIRVLHRFINEAEPYLQEVMLQKLFSSSIAKQLFYEEVSRLPTLRYFRLEQMTPVTSLHDFRGLRILELLEVTLAKEDCTVLANFPELESLSLSFSRSKSLPQVLISHVRPHRLRKLTIHSDVHPSIVTLLIKTQTNLHDLKIKLTEISPWMISTLFLGLPQIRDFQVSLA